MLTKLTIQFPGQAEIDENKLSTLLWNQEALEIPQSLVGNRNLYWSKETRKKYKEIQESQDRWIKLAYNYAIAAFALENYPNFIDYTDELLYNPGTHFKALPIIEKDMEISGISKNIRDVFDKPFMYMDRFSEKYQEDIAEKKANNKIIQPKTLMKMFMVNYAMDHDYMFRKFLENKKTIFETSNMDILMNIEMKAEILNERLKKENIKSNSSAETAIIGWMIVQIEKEMLDRYVNKIESKYKAPWNFKSDIKEKEKQEKIEKEKQRLEEEKKRAEEKEKEEPLHIGTEEIDNNAQGLTDTLLALKEKNKIEVEKTPENDNNKKIMFLNPEGVYDIDIPNFSTYTMKLLKASAQMELKVKDLITDFNKQNQPFRIIVIPEKDKDIYKEFMENIINGNIGSRDLIKLLAEVRKETMHHA